MRQRLSNVTFTLNSKPTQTLYNQLTWCNKQKQAKRNKPAKINGVQHHEISDSVEHVYYQPLR